MPDAPDTLRVRQLAFAHHVRDPGTNPPPPGVEARRLRVYRDLFFNGIGGLLAANFPVIRRTLPDPEWQALVRAFYTGHRCSTPLFTEVAGEFVDWLALQDPATGGHPPWLAELAHYEWIELVLQIHDAAPRAACDAELTLSPLARPLAYAWPVHRIGPDHRPTEAPGTPTLLLARRDDAGDVHFSELSPLVFRLLRLLDTDAGPRTADAVLSTLAVEAGETGNAGFHASGRAMLLRLEKEGVVLRALC